MAPKFGTSGLRGLVTDLTPALVGDYVAAFAVACDTGTGVFLGHDLRKSSPDIRHMVAKAAQAAGLAVTDCGAVPTPALALAAMRAGAGAIMITGSHIPADRNGLKFYTPQGEITKIEEKAILGALGRVPDGPTGPPVARHSDAAEAYVSRYTKAYGSSLQGMRIGIFAHSAVGADLLETLLTRLGAKTLILGRSERFIPVDTEAVAQQLRDQLRAWAATGDFDGIVSTDADGDRPLVADETGAIVPGDVLGQITAAALGAQVVVTPVSSNTGVDQAGRFGQVIRTAIGSPYVIAAMEGALGRVVGYEANGGFLLGFDAAGPSGPIARLLTRDAILPMVAVLAQANGSGLAQLVAAEPARFTASDRLQDVPTVTSQNLLARLTADPAARQRFLRALDAKETALDLVDGVRVHLDDGRIIHLRPSGNAPELRCYVEAGTPWDAADTLAQGLALLRDELTG
ncbi:phosphomannomutase [Yoonia sp.]|uniref:phosphomannomutase n=1 Tax=Yoonia sp. TaxID=2212373 RepID=UPI0019E152F4|nr:phosphomannomutase [Yoonia sp.]MBE0413665.1 phosphomannomutase [Yoonia sp.]